MHQHRPVSRTPLATGVTVAHVSSGPETGTPVVLLHPWGESRQSFDRLVPLLPDGVRAIALDQRGHGDAERPTSGYSLAEAGDDVVAFLDALDLTSAVLVGSSSGGYVAQQVAVTRPDRVTGLVLLGSPRSLQEPPSFAAEVDRLTDPVDSEWVREALAWFPLHHPVPRWYLDDRVRDGAGIPAHVWRAVLHGLVEATPPTDRGPITAPTLLICGELDDLVGDDQAAIAAAARDARTVVYEDTGHLVLWEQPDRIAADLGRFLGEVRGPDLPTAPPPA